MCSFNFASSHGYNGENELTKNLYSLLEDEILYVIDSICILYEPKLKQQRFYTKHHNSITWYEMFY